MTLSTLLLVVLVLLLVGALPTWPHSRTWGYGPSGLLVLVLALLRTGPLCRAASAPSSAGAARTGSPTASATAGTLPSNGLNAPSLLSFRRLVEPACRYFVEHAEAMLCCCVDSGCVILFDEIGRSEVFAQGPPGRARAAR